MLALIWRLNANIAVLTRADSEASSTLLAACGAVVAGHGRNGGRLALVGVGQVAGVAHKLDGWTNGASHGSTDPEALFRLRTLTY